MNNKTTVRDNDGNEFTIEILSTFNFKDLNKNYVVYTVNDDGVSETVTVLINEIVYENDQPKIVPIPKNEINLVLAFYNTIRENI